MHDQVVCSTNQKPNSWFDVPEARTGGKVIMVPELTSSAAGLRATLCMYASQIEALRRLKSNSSKQHRPVRRLKLLIRMGLR